MKLALGTAQFGFAYGIAGSDQVHQDEVRNILKRAREAGIDTIDTAISYVESEKQLGNASVAGLNVITKLPSIPEDLTDVASWVSSQVEESLGRLKIQQIGGLLFHEPSQLLEQSGNELWRAAQSLKTNTIVSKIGYSIYDPSELDLLFNTFRPDIVQVPYNIIDRRIEKSGWMQRLYEDGVEIHVRSVFLQGLLLMSQKNRPAQFKTWSGLWSIWESWLHENQVSPLEACLSFALQESRINSVIVGVDSIAQLDEILAGSYKKIKQFPTEVESTDVNLVHPSRWKTI
jgi:aryl-alcohol dehydrogenase-like predicted oxidoreductase